MSELGNLVEKMKADAAQRSIERAECEKEIAEAISECDTMIEEEAKTLVLLVGKESAHSIIKMCSLISNLRILEEGKEMLKGDV